ncbi:MAG: tetratricopeptide repeat protein [Cyanobacteria bacterium P01_E01_bin.6]
MSVLERLRKRLSDSITVFLAKHEALQENSTTQDIEAYLGIWGILRGCYEEEPELVPSSDWNKFYRSIGLLFLREGDQEQAIESAERYTERVEKHLGHGCNEYAASLNHLALLYQNIGHYEEAKSLYQKALTIYEQQPDTNPSNIAANVNNLALLYRDMGRYEKAEQLYQKALTMYEQHLGSNHMDTVIVLNNLAALFNVMSRNKEAEALLGLTQSERSSRATNRESFARVNQ